MPSKCIHEKILEIIKNNKNLTMYELKKLIRKELPNEKVYNEDLEKYVSEAFENNKNDNDVER